MSVDSGDALTFAACLKTMRGESLMLP